VSREITFHFPDGGVQRFRSSDSPRVGETVAALGQAWVVTAVTADGYALATPKQATHEAGPKGSLRGIGLRFVSLEPAGRSRASGS
jgi:hypothetical protein